MPQDKREISKLTLKAMRRASILRQIAQEKKRVAGYACPTKRDTPILRSLREQLRKLDELPDDK